ncbi:C40 family peptidase [Escherichia coli]
MLIHSHPDVVRLVPSELDRIQCDWSGIEWGIMSWPDGDFCTISPREDRDYAGRQWVLGYADCWSLIREFYLREYGIVLGNYSVPYEWWESGEERLYDDNWEREGFVEVAAGAMQPGDIIMMSVQASVTNHAAVYVGDNIILHHLFGHLSSRTPYGKYYRDRTVRVVRHKDRMHG